MEFKMGDIININPDSAYISQGMLDRSFMEGVVISQIEYEIASTNLASCSEERNFESTNLLKC
jgi:hypothetical protein